MHLLSVIKHAAMAALDKDDETPGDASPPRVLMDSKSVLELVELAERRITDEELLALHQVIGELGDYIRRTAPGPDAMRLLLHAKRIVGITSR